MVIERIEEHFPRYLTSGELSDLAEALQDFENKPYFTHRYANEILQGDGWSGLTLLNFGTGERADVWGVVWSNSCDVDPGNDHDFPPNIIFAPLIALDRYEALLLDRGFDRQKVINKIASIRQQRVTSIFFVPANDKLERDHIAVLDDVHSLPRKVFAEKKDRKKLFTLGQMGFYLFVLKLSIHLCRFGEKVSRGERAF